MKANLLMYVPSKKSQPTLLPVIYIYIYIYIYIERERERESRGQKKNKRALLQESFGIWNSNSRELGKMIMNHECIANCSFNLSVHVFLKKRIKDIVYLIFIFFNLMVINIFKLTYSNHGLNLN